MQKKIYEKFILLLFLLLLFIITLIIFDWILLAIENYRIPRSVNYEEALMVRGINSDPFDEVKFNTKTLKIDEKKPSIIIMGGSFAYGLGLYEDETLSYKISQYTKRKTYNYAYPMQGIQHVLFKIKNNKKFEESVKNSEYVIYVFITDHLRRMYYNFFNVKYNPGKYLKYNKTNNGLEEANPNITPLDYLKITATGIKFNNFFYNIKNDNEKFDLLKSYLEECKKNIELKNPNCKMAVVVYNSTHNSKNIGIKPFHTDRWKELEDEGFIVINFDTKEYDFLNTKEYLIDDGLHPSPLAWDKLTPIIAKRLNL